MDFRGVPRADGKLADRYACMGEKGRETALAVPADARFRLEHRRFHAGMSIPDHRRVHFHCYRVDAARIPNSSPSSSISRPRIFRPLSLSLFISLHRSRYSCITSLYNHDLVLGHDRSDIIRTTDFSHPFREFLKFLSGLK